MDEPIRNKVALAKIEELNLLDYQPPYEFVEFDIVPLLCEGLILKEKPFKAEINKIDWSFYEDKAVYVTCKNDAIVPQWAYMVIAEKLKDRAIYVSFGAKDKLKLKLWEKNILEADFSVYQDKKVTLKASMEVPETIYMSVTTVLINVVKTLMYGEPGLPKVIYKKKEL